MGPQFDTPRPPGVLPRSWWRGTPAKYSGYAPSTATGIARGFTCGTVRHSSTLRDDSAAASVQLLQALIWTCRGPRRFAVSSSRHRKQQCTSISLRRLDWDPADEILLGGPVEAASRLSTRPSVQLNL